MLPRGILNANYIAQDYLEQLDNTSYAQALADLPAKQQTGNYYLSATMTPHGAGSGLLNRPACMHICCLAKTVKCWL